HTDAQQHHGVPDGGPGPVGGTQGPAVHLHIDLDGGQLGHGEDEQAAEDQGQHHGQEPDAPGLPAGDAVPLDDADGGLPLHGSAHAPTASFPKLVIIRPTSSLVAVRPSTTPLTLPAHSTRIRSHSSSSTSRSSPTKMTATPFFFCSVSRL